MISILIPCLNEEKFIEECLRSVIAFELPYGQSVEILVLDGGSTDGTRAMVERFSASDPRIKLVNNHGRIQSCALNLGIRMASGEWIMRLDAHTHYPANYLLLCYETALTTGADNVGGVCITHPGNDSYSAQLVQALTTHRFGVGNSGFRTGVLGGYRDTVPFGFFRRDVFDRIGYFDERLVRTQDYEFNSRIRRSGGEIYLNPTIVSSYFNLPSLSAFLKKQLSKQGPFNAYLWYLAPYSFVPRHGVTVCFVVFLLVGLLASLLTSVHLPVFGGILFLYAVLAIAASVQQSIRYRDLRHLFCLPIGFFLFHFCHGLGVLTGLLKLAAGATPVQKILEPWPGAGKFRAWP